MIDDLFDSSANKKSFIPYVKKDYSQNPQQNGLKKKPIIREIVITELYRPFFVFSIEPVPEEILKKAQEAAGMLEENHFTLRTDTVGVLAKEFEKIITRKEEYLPWQDFNNKKSKFHFNTQSAKNMARLFSPKFDELKKPVQAFQSRNARSILGQNVKSPVHLSILWSPDGAQSIKERTPKSSFISHPLAICSAIKIPLFNLQREDCLSRLKEYLES
jgi:hypothetical protein